MKKKLLIATIPNMIEKEDVAHLEKKFDIDWAVQEHLEQTILASMSKEYDYLMLNYDIIKNLTESFYRNVANSKLKAISTDITGMSWANPPLAKKYGITLMNTPNYCTQSVAEYTIMQMLVYAKTADLIYKDMLNGNYPEARKGINLHNSVLGIVGFGNIGSTVAKIALGFGMKVIAYDRNPKHVKGVEFVDMETLCKESDFISIHLKTVPNATTNFFDEKYFALCKSTCFMVNQADIDLVEIKALKKALKTHKIAGYAGTLNKKTEQLQNYDRVILFPANAWNSDESLQNLKNIWIDNIVSYDKGKIKNLITE